MMPFARVFGGSIVPSRSQKPLLRQEADAGATESARFRAIGFWLPTNTSLPSVCTTTGKWAPTRTSLRTTFAKAVGGIHRRTGWQTYGEVVVRFEQSSNLHTGQFRARGAVNPDVEPARRPDDLASPQSDHAFSAEPGVPMTENSSYRGGHGQGRPGDDYYDEHYGHPARRPARSGSPGSAYPPEPGRLPRPARLSGRATRPRPWLSRRKAATPTNAATPSKAATKNRRRYPDQRGYARSKGDTWSNAGTPTSAATPSKGIPGARRLP